MKDGRKVIEVKVEVGCLAYTYSKQVPSTLFDLVYVLNHELVALTG